MKTLSPSFLFALLALSACASGGTKHYQQKGQPNLKISLEAGSTSYASKRIEVDVDQVIPPCEYRYLGTVKVDDHSSQAIAIPEDGELMLRANYTEESRIANDVGNSSRLFRWAPEKGAIYQLEVIEKDVDEEMDLYRLGPGGRIKVESQGPVPCHALREVK